MIKVKDGYGKLIGTTYQGSATQVLLSNGGNLELSSETKANTLVQRNASQHIYATYFNSAISDEALTDIGSVYVRNTSDTFIRRISKTQFYSIIDNKFVTLDTAQTITGVKTFSTGPILANNATITQNQNSTSNYTTVVKWLKGGTSQGTYNPSIGQHNTGGDGTGSICILPYPTSTDPWGGTVGLFIGKGVLRLDGKAVAIAENYYTKTESDERYVNVTGDTMTGPLIVKASITGTQLISNIADGTAPLKVTSKTVVTNLNSDLLDGYHETSFFRARGSQTIASSIPTTTELSSNNNLSGNWNVTYPGASGHLVQFNTGSGSTRYMQFYSYYSGSLYWRNSTDSTLNTKSWKTIVDSANYTGIVLKIGTATKGSATLPIYLNAGTPTACSTTLGVSITGNAATATKLQTARTINGTSFDGSANITTAYWGATRTITLSGAVTGSASVNGSQNVTITTTYQTGSIDGRYVGGKKTAGHGSQGTAYTADTYSSNFVNKAFVAYAERGSWAYANNGYITTDTGVNIPLAGTAIFQWGASDTNKTQLFITPMNNGGVSNPAVNEMLFYTSNGSKYSSGWSRVLTNRNYTIYTVTKTGGGASGTWGISITGNAATANRIISHSISDTLANKTTPGYLYHAGGSNSVKDKPSGVDAFGVFTMQTASGQYGQLLMSSNTSTGLYWRTATSLNGGWKKILDSSNYTAYVNPANFVTSLGTNGNYVTWTKNGTTNNLTVPFATTSNVLNNLGNRTAISGTTVGQRGLRLYEVYKNGYPVNYGNVLNIGGQGYGELLFQWTGDSNPGHLYYRSKRDAASQAWSNWVTILDNNNYSSTLDGRYVTLATNQTVSGIKTFSTQQKFTVATGTSPFTVSSTTVVSNLNADMLDGYHANSFVKIAGTRFSQYQQGTYTKILEFTITSGSLQPSITFTWHPSEYARDVWADFSINIRSSAIIFYANWKGAARRNLWCVGNGTTYSVWVSGTKSSWDPYGVVQVMSTWGINTYKIGSLQYADTAPSGTYSATAITSGWASRVVGTLTMTAGKFLSKTYNGSADVTVNIPTNTSHLTNDSGFWTGTRYWANIAVSTASSTGTKPTFNTCYTSNWFRSTGNTGWYSESYGGGWYMTDSTWIRTYGNKSVYQNSGQIRTDGHLVTNGGLTAGATSPNNGTYKLHVTGASWSSGLIRAGGGFYHNSVNSNSYVLLAGGSYKGLGDFAKGNAGSATKGVYVTGGTVTAMTYSLSSNLNSGTSGKLAYYSSATTVAAYSSSVGSSAQPIYLNAGSLSASSYSFTGTYSNPVIVWCGEIYRSTPGSTYWYSVKKGGCCSISFTTNNAGSNGNLIISIPHCEPYAAFCSTVRIFDGSTAISAGDGTITGRSAGMGDYMTICGVSGTTGNVYIRKFSQQNTNNDTWRNGELGTTTTSNGNKPVARFYLMIVGRYI